MKNKNGYIAIASVLVIAAIVLTIAVTVSLLSINDIQSALANKKGVEALNLVEACVENALLQLNEENTIDLVITIPQGECFVTIDSQSGSNWTFTVSGEFENYTKNIQISASRVSTVEVTNWSEL